MDTSLLATRLQTPPLSRRVIYREHLVTALESELLRYKLCLLAAPAGYGKTTLLAQWARTSRFPVAWLSIDAEINSLERFLRHVLAAWEMVQPDILDSELGLLLGARIADTQTVLTALVNYASAMSGHVVFVLDDYHLIEDESIHEALSFLLDHVPPMLHVVLAGRAEPLLPLARYRARGELFELRAEDLKFLPDETADFLNHLMELDLPPDDVMALQAQLEGWIAGLQLAALSLRRRLAIDKVVISGRHRFIADYLSDEVLAPLPDELQHFMLEISVLARLCGSLCDAVTGREDGQAMLEALERESLFLVPLDARREWFRFHRLFADFLMECLKQRHPDTIPDLHRRAAGWYLAHDLPEQAFPHAASGGDVDLVRQIFKRHMIAKLLGGEIKVAQRWLESLPDQWRASDPLIGIAQAGMLLITGQFEACEDHLDAIERLTHEGQDDAEYLQARVTAMRCNIACFQNDLRSAERLAERALRDLPEDDLDFRAGIYGALGDTYRRNGYWQEAQGSYRKLLDYTHTPSFRVQAVHVYGALADLSLRQGRLRSAADYWKRALAAIQERKNWGSYPLPLIGWVYIRLGELLYEWNDLPRAWDHLLRGLERAELGGDVRAMIAGYVIAGRIRLTQGDHEAAATYLERARLHVENTQFAYWVSRFERLQLELWLAQDRLRAAVNWSDQMLRDAAVAERPESEIAQLAMARVLIVKSDGSSIERALALLENLLHTADEQGRTGIVIEALALQALARWQRGEKTDALTALERALRLGEPENYVRLFADLGLPMARVLQLAQSRDVMPRYVAGLLAGFTPDIVPAESPQATLPEPLTEREHEILEQIAAGLTNQEIAEMLVVSPETVKKHASNIYHKMGVGNRTEAAARARELNLLDRP